MMRASAPTPEGVASRRWIRAVLLLLLAWSLAPRLWLASTELDGGRWWDERINLENVAAILRSGRSRPANFWYGSLSYLPQTAVLAAWGRLSGDAGFALVDGGDYTPGVYLVCRLLQVGYGVLSIAVAYLVGRRLFSPRVGLLAACLLAASPRHVQASAVFKPDVLLLLTSLAALYGCSRVARRPNLASYLLAGVAVGLATATKLNGATLAIPLVALTAASGAQKAGRWLRLLLAGTAAFLVFLALNPHLEEHLRFLAANRALYEDHATGSNLTVLGQTLSFLLDETFHGPWIAILSLGGLIHVARSIAAAGWTAGESPLRIAFLSYPIAYFLIYAALTTRAKENHFLQILPFTSILAAYLLVAAWDRVAARLAAARRRPLAIAFAVLAALWTAAGSFGYAYGVVVPHTGDLAAGLLRQSLPEPLAGRWICSETAVAPRKRPAGGAAQWIAERLSDLSPEALDRADAEVFLRQNLKAHGHDFYLRRLARLDPSGVRIIEPRWLKAQGPDLVVLLHPLALAGPPEGELSELRPAAGGSFTAALPAPADLVSFGLWVSWRHGALQRMSLRLGDDPLDLAPVLRWQPGRLFLSPRVKLAAPRSEITLEIDPESEPPEEVELRIYRWVAE